MTLSQIPNNLKPPASGNPRLRGLFIMDQDAFNLIYDGDNYQAINQMVDLVGPLQSQQSILSKPELLNSIDIIFSGWGMPNVDATFLKHAPNLKAIFYGAGAIGYFATREMWIRNIVVTSAIHANSIPVAEYTLATILFSLKQGWQLARATREQKTFVPRDIAPGAYGSTVGIVSLGEIARLLIKRLRPFDVNLIAYDPHVTDETAEALGVKRVSLQELFTTSDVVTIHTPLLPETIGLVDGKLINSMKPGSTLINTARGGIINQPQMLDVLAKRTDLQAVLDVCEPEPPAADSPLFSLPNVVLTPHIAGSVGPECKRMGKYMVDELRRYLRGERLMHQVRPEETAHSSNRPAMTVVNSALKSNIIAETI